MSKSEVEEKYFPEFCIWCATAPEGNQNALIFWLDHNSPTVDNFWEWVVKYKTEDIGGKASGIEND